MGRTTFEFYRKSKLQTSPQTFMTYNYQPIAWGEKRSLLFLYTMLLTSLNRNPAVVHDFGAHNHSPAVDLSRDKLLNHRAISDDNYRAINSDENLWFVKTLQGHRKIKKRNKDIKKTHNKGHNQVSQRSVGAMTNYVYL